MIDFLADLLDLPGALLVVLIFVPLERLLPQRPGQPTLRADWKIDAAYFILNRIPIGLGLLAVILLSMMAGEAILPAEFRVSVAAQPLWLQVIEVIIISDLVFYLMHRLFHVVPALWRFHAVHHSIEDLDWLAAHRIHPVDQILTKGASLVPVFMLGFSGASLLIFYLIFKWHTLLLHANLRVDFGPLRWIIASPAFHHWHHAEDRAAWDRNFAAQLPVWDFMFRTANMPPGRLPASYGIGERLPGSYLLQMIHPFRRDRDEGEATAEVAAERQPA